MKNRSNKEEIENGKKRTKYKMVLTTAPSKHNYTQEEINERVDKAITLILDELILNGHLDISNNTTTDSSKLNKRKRDT